MIARNEQPIQGSPFTVNISDKDMAHASKVKITGPTVDANANEPNALKIDTSCAGENV